MPTPEKHCVPATGSTSVSVRSEGGASKDAATLKSIDWGHFNLLLERFALIYGTDSVWDGGTRMIMKIANMAHAHGSDLVRMWKTHSDRRTISIEQVVFDPTKTCGEECVNLFAGIAIDPMEGDVEPVLELMRFLVSRVSEDEGKRAEILHWLTCWIAYPLQNLGAKLRTAVIMHGDEGAGKNFLFDLVVDIYGKYGTLVGQDELEDKFNDWRSGKMLVIGDEVSSRAELVHNKNRLKALITSPTVQINPKGLPRRQESNNINIVFLSNEMQPLALDNSDRRYLVVYTPRPQEREYYLKLKSWRDDAGPAKFYRYLLDYDVSAFDPYAPAPFTQAKADLIDINRKSPERFWLEWSQGSLDLPYQSCSMEQAFRAYEKYARSIGDRFPFQANVASRMMARIAENHEKPFAIKQMQLAKEVNGRRNYRMMLVCEPNIEHGQTNGEWAALTVKAFELHLRRYIGGGSVGWAQQPKEHETADRGGQ